MKTQIRISTLRAAIHCAATKDVRHLINGVYLEFVHGEVPHINVVSTTGAILSAFREPLEYMDDAQTADWSIIVPLDAIKTAIKGVGKHLKHLTIESLPDGRYVLGDTIFSAIDGIYPTYRRVIPAHDAPRCTADNIPVCDPDLMVKGKAALADFYGWKKDGNAQIFYGDRIVTMHAGASGAVIVVMPLSMGNVTYSHNSDSYQGFNGYFSEE